MARSPPLLFAWITYFLMFSSWVIILGGVSASQRYCGAASADAITAGGGAGYFAPVPCDHLYQFTWWITWYEFALVIIVPIILGLGKVHTWRYGLIGVILPATYLLMATANSFFTLRLNINNNRGGPRTVLAGSIIGSVANFFMIILLGIRDESPKSASETS